jgi:hypothetical protein
MAIPQRTQLLPIGIAFVIATIRGNAHLTVVAQIVASPDAGQNNVLRVTVRIHQTRSGTDMTTFKYEALDISGNEVKDSIEATNEEEASTKIKSMGYFVTKLTVTAVAITKGKKEKKTGQTHNRAPITKPWYAEIWDALTKFTCPECGESSGVKTDRKIVYSWDHIKTVMQEEKHYDRDGSYAGSTRRPVQVAVCTVVYDQNYRCEDCKHTWSERNTYERQP